LLGGVLIVRRSQRDAVGDFVAGDYHRQAIFALVDAVLSGESR
jgi:hypothetical protein